LAQVPAFIVSRRTCRPLSLSPRSPLLTMGAACSQNRPHQPESAATAPAGKAPANASATRSGPSGAGKRGHTADQSGHFVLKHAGNVAEVYAIDSKKIGEGAFGSVCLGKHKASGAVRAIKTVAKGNPKMYQMLQLEIATMKEMDHPHIVKLFDTFEDRKCVYFAMELCEGGELFDRITTTKFTESIAALVMRQILQAVHYMQSSNVAHRDLKPENFLVLRKDPIGEDGNMLKLIDFGMAKRCAPGQLLRSRVGTPLYMAPQVLMRRYDTQCDTWSAGVIMYILLSGRPPFTGVNEEAMLEKVRAGAWKFQGDCWEQVSEDAKALIRMMLKRSSEARATAAQALDTVWIKELAPRATDAKLDNTVIEGLQAFKTQNRLKKAALEIVARGMNEDSLKKLRESFQALDVNQDGKLSMAELVGGIENSGLDVGDVDIEQLVSGLDVDGSGTVDYTEFLAATIDRKTLLTQEVLWSAFNIFDQNGDGKITQQELKNVLGSADVEKHIGAESIGSVMKEVDTSGDGVIEFDEFVTLMTQTIQGNCGCAPTKGCEAGEAGEACEARASDETDEAIAPTSVELSEKEADEADEATAPTSVELSEKKAEEADEATAPTSVEPSEKKAGEA